MPFTTGCCLTFFRLQIDCLMILKKHARIALFLVHCLSKSTPQYGPSDMLFLFSPGRCLVIYGKGLALNSMEGSEAKHQAIFWNAFKTNFLNRWKQVFFHEFISAIWLQEKPYNLISASSCNKTYNPNWNFQSDHCYCGIGAFTGVRPFINTFKHKNLSGLIGIFKVIIATVVSQWQIRGANIATVHAEPKSLKVLKKCMLAIQGMVSRR